jgi:hypothetical protein
MSAQILSLLLPAPAPTPSADPQGRSALEALGRILYDSPDRGTEVARKLERSPEAVDRLAQAVRDDRSALGVLAQHVRGSTASAAERLLRAVRRRAVELDVLEAVAWAASRADEQLWPEHRACFWRKGEVWIQAGVLIRHWELVAGLGHVPWAPPTVHAAGSALRRLSLDGERVYRTIPEVGSVKVHRLAAELVLEVAEHAGMEPEQLNESRQRLAAE